ncbi:MAG: hypothetical protein N3G76_03080 [Candidatus Micrarchaeota archaeon]|nr:hypothetical protein [Candidatus Micrarchaeota archaeon]
MGTKKENKKGFAERIRAEFFDGVSKVSLSMKNGLDDAAIRWPLMLKYTVFTLIVAFLYVAGLAMFPDMSLVSYTVFLPISALILLFHHELFSIQVKDIARLAYSTVMLSLFFFVVYQLFSYGTAGSHAGDKSGPLAIASSTLAMFLFVIMLFMPAYSVKAGSSPLSALKNAFRFLARNAVKGMFYVIVLLTALSLLTAAFSMIGLAFASPIVFIFLSYTIFIFINAFWEVCRND